MGKYTFSKRTGKMIGGKNTQWPNEKKPDWDQSAQKGCQLDYGGKDSYRSMKRIQKLGIKEQFSQDRHSDATSITTANTVKVGRKRNHIEHYGKYTPFSNFGEIW
jgi:hypothetical protein